jgi:hypothetical protein
MDTSAYRCPKNALCKEIDGRAMLVTAAAVCLRGWLSVDTIEDFAVLGALLLFGSLSLGVIVLIY